MIRQVTFGFLISMMSSCPIFYVHALDGVSCCILGTFCIKELYVVQRGKGSVALVGVLGRLKHKAVMMSAI